MNDRWKYLRRDLFRNKEPEVKLIGITQFIDSQHVIENGLYELKDLCESIPGFVARKSHESKGNSKNDIELGKKLIEWKHETPLEFIQIILEVDGISKTCMTQWDRQRIGIGFVQRSTRYVSADQNKFVYPTFDYIDHELKVQGMYSICESQNRQAITYYQRLTEQNSTKQDARRIMPVSFSTGTYVYMNVRSLRHFFKLRLDKHAEWEIQRLAGMIWDLLYPIFPSLLDDIKELRVNI